MRPALPPVGPLPAALLLALAACAPQTRIPVDLAEAQCVQSVLAGGTGSNSAVTVGIGTGYGGWGWGGGGWGGTGVAMSTTLPVGGSGGSPAQQYNNCVLRKSGQPPFTPFADRPELKG
jgi:hypothetical protein